MKRFFKSFINSFSSWWKPLKKYEKVAHTIGLVIGICSFLLFFIAADKVPATASDYEPFEKQAIAAQENPEILLKKDCNISVNGDIITVVFSNDECKVTAEYNQNFELLSISKENSEYYMFWLLAFIFALALGFCIGGISAILIVFITSLLLDLFDYIRNKRKTIKSNSKK